VTWRQSAEQSRAAGGPQARGAAAEDKCDTQASERQTRPRARTMHLASTECVHAHTLRVCGA
jgi:hypothetical protein